MKRKFAAAGLLVSTLGAGAFQTLGKLAVQRPRPLEGLVFEPTYSFPSGHATQSVAFYGFIAYLLIRSTSRVNVQVRLFFAAAGLALLIGLSRILLGAHYLIDVWAGYLVGTLWLIVGISLNEWLAATGRITWNASQDPRRKIAAGVLAAAAMTGIIAFASLHHPPLRSAPAQTVVQLDRPLVAVLQARKLTHTSTFLGAQEQPLTFAILAPGEDTLTATLERAGWAPADKPALRSMMRLAKEGLDYSTAPVSPAFWDHKINDLAFERRLDDGQTPKLATIRIWRSPFQAGGNHIFVGVAREYIGTRWFLTHTVSPDIDGAAEAFIKTLDALGQPLGQCRQTLVPPAIGTYLMGDQFFARGQLWILALGASAQAGPLCQETGGAPGNQAPPGPASHSPASP